MGRPRKPIQKRISGKGYSKSEAAAMKYKRQAKDGTWEIDTDTIKNLAEAYIKDNSDEEGNLIKPLSEPGYMLALDIYNRETLHLWLSGYVNRDHVNDEEYTYNQALTDALAQGWYKIGKHLLEDESGKYMSRIRERQAETAGFLTPTKKVSETTIKIVSDKWRKKVK